MKSHWVRVTMAALAASLLIAGPVSAFEAPLLVPVQSKPGSVRLMVHAGESGAPFGFQIERMKRSEYDALGGWPASPTGSWMTGAFTGIPSFNIEGSADAYALAAGEVIEVELGQLFAETGVVATDLEELDPDTEYVIRVRTTGFGPWLPGPFTETMVVGSAPLAQNCTFTQGYWKNHPESWPVGSLTLGTVNYTAAELLLILKTAPQGRRILILAHQLIAAKLNLANGADPGSAATTIADADALIGAQVCPPLGSGVLANQPAIGYANLLDDFNNGLIGPGHCLVVPATAKTWGSVKAQYRN